ncbi:poly(A) binding protein [Carabus blaptoides fortunei]
MPKRSVFHKINAMTLNPVIPNHFAMATLYVGDLHQDVTEAILYEKFCTIGPMVSLHVCRDIVSRRSLGYAYVNFVQVADAERALDTMNFDLVKGRPIRIMWSQRDPTLRKSGIGNVFIKNLEKGIDNKSLFDTFSAFGNILSCKVAHDNNGDSKGFGFVHFETQEGANKAISKVNGMLLNGKKVYVGKFVSRVEREKQLGEKYKLFTNVFLKNFGDKLDDESIIKMFELYGLITSYKIVKNDDGSSKGFGFVAYKDPKSADLAVRNLNGKEIAEGVALYVGRAQKKSERETELQKKYDQLRSERFMRYQGSNLFIKNLDDTIDDERLRKEFEKYGTITSAIVMKENDRSKGFGFVCYSTPEAATKAVTEMNCRLVGSKPLYVALAQRKEDRKAYLSSIHLNRPNFRTQPPQFTNNVNGFYGAPQLIPQGRLYSQPSITPMRTASPTPRWSIPAHIRACAPGGSMASLVTPVYNLRPYRTSSMPNNNVRSILPRPITGGQDGQRKRNNNNPSSRIVQPRQVRFQEPSTNAISSVVAATADPEIQKQVLGERLFPLIFPSHPTLAAKITGMLLEIDNSELLRILDDKDSLQAKMSEAVAVLEAHGFQKAVEAAQ